MKLSTILLSVFIFTPCHSTEISKKAESFPFQEKSYNPQIIDEIAINELPTIRVPVKEQELVQPSTEPFRQSNKNIVKQELVNNSESSLLNQQACRDNVEVTYKVVDQNAVSGTFHAKVQAQGVILSLSQDQKDIKLRTTGWFTKNLNLQKWQPYLTKPPLAKSILLKTGSEFWNSKSHWYLCGNN